MILKSSRGERSHVAETASVTSSESDETLFTPSGVPRVLDLPVLTSSRVTNQEDTVIEISTAVTEDTLGVELEVVGIDSDGDGLLLNLS